MAGNVFDTLRGSPRADTAGAAVVHALLIVAWHGLLPPLIFCMIEPLAPQERGEIALLPFRIRTQLDTLNRTNAHLAIPCGAGALILLGLPLTPFLCRAEWKRENFTWRRWLRAWWRSCLWGTLLFPAFLAVAADVPMTQPGVALAFLLVVLTYYALAPAALGLDELPHVRTRRRRWQPVCPECGYSLRRCRSERCPECGAAFPQPARFFRRWAVRRLTWDRRLRPLLPWAYVRTMSALTLWPCGAAWRLAIPDRFGRATRWAVAHILLLALFGTAFSHAEELRRFWSAPPSPFPEEVTAMWRGFAVRCGHTVAAWSAVGGALLLVGLGLVYAWPRLTPAVRAGWTKWTLYCTALAIWPAMLACVTRGVAMLVAATRSEQLPLMPAEVGACVGSFFAAYWGVGLALNPRVSRRRGRLYIAALSVFVAVWWAVGRFVFPPAELAVLL